MKQHKFQIKKKDMIQFLEELPLSVNNRYLIVVNNIRWSNIIYGIQDLRK